MRVSASHSSCAHPRPCLPSCRLVSSYLNALPAPPKTLRISMYYLLVALCLRVSKHCPPLVLSSRFVVNTRQRAAESCTREETWDGRKHDGRRCEAGSEEGGRCKVQSIRESPGTLVCVCVSVCLCVCRLSIVYTEE